MGAGLTRPRCAVKCDKGDTGPPDDTHRDADDVREGGPAQPETGGGGGAGGGSGLRLVAGRGGLITRTPHDFVIPRPGRWFIVAHSWGLRDAARVSVQRLPRVQTMSPTTPTIVDLRSIARNAVRYPGDEEGPPVAPAIKKYHVFISHVRRSTSSPSKSESNTTSSRTFTSSTCCSRGTRDRVEAGQVSGKLLCARTLAWPDGGWSASRRGVILVPSRPTVI
jgi:hypothetical protein